MAVENKTDHVDDEEDLEALRLAALNSLKKKNEASEPKSKKEFTSLPYNNYKGSFKGGKRRFFPGQHNRGNRNGQFNNQVRNTNLISIPTSTECSEKTELRSSKFATKVEEAPKLILPQDRYANATTQEAESDGPSSKFDRYNNSNSESEEEDEISDSKLERCDSLEALMEELDAEILGEPVKDRKAKIKKENKNVEEKKDEEKLDTETKNEEVNDKEVEKSNEEVIVHNQNESKPVAKSPEPTEEKPNAQDGIKVENQKKIAGTSKPQVQRSPNQRKLAHRRMNNGRVFNPHQPVNKPLSIPNQPYINPIPAPQFTTVYNTVPSYTIPEVFPMNVPPPYIPPPSMPPCIMPLDLPPVGFNVPPLHPLVIEPPGPISSIPLGQLSPRSAAFVLQNRAIVEKRKRSPRRSFSRSPSPLHHRPRYSKSPPGSGRSHSPLRRSLSPSRRPFSPLQRSNSPRRSPPRRSLSPYRRNRDKSPRRDSPRRSPRRGRNSPKRSPKRTRESPKRTKESRRTPLKDRLGNRKQNEEKEPPKKEEPVTSPAKKLDSKPLDPVLEARKKKFESKEINVKERVIRLKPKEEPVQKDDSPRHKVDEAPKVKPVVEKTIDQTVQPKSITERRSKSPVRTSPKQETTRIVLLPKSETKMPAQTKTPEEPRGDQLEDAINELEMLLKDDEALELTAKVDDLFTDEETDQENEAKRLAVANEDDQPARKVANGASKQSSERKKDTTKSKWRFEETKKEPKKTKKEPLTNPIENRKIEIKIRNPSKYEKNGSKVVQGVAQSTSGRTVELTKKESFSEDESEPEIVMEDEDEVEEVTTSREGDLRAQLSRKRAERQNKLPNVEGVQSRLLQSALEGAVFKKKKSKKKDKESKDVKLPIHLRLGIAHDSDLFTESIVTEKISRKKSKKRKHTEMEQV